MTSAFYAPRTASDWDDAAPAGSPVMIDPADHSQFAVETFICRRSDGSIDVDHYDHAARHLRARDLRFALTTLIAPARWVLGASWWRKHSH
jgi:hypothetical protein